MDGLFSSLTKAVSGKDKEEQAPPTPDSKDAAAGGAAPSNAELMASAKVVAEAAQSAMQSKSADKIDKAKLAEAAEDLVQAGEKYGKLDEKGYGTYVDKAEEYLHQYGGSKPAEAAAAAPPADNKPAEAAAAPPAEESKEKPAEGGSLGGYAKMAEGFLK